MKENQQLLCCMWRVLLRNTWNERAWWWISVTPATQKTEAGEL
jgi:hypothetical protein